MLSEATSAVQSVQCSGVTRVDLYKVDYLSSLQCSAVPGELFVPSYCDEGKITTSEQTGLLLGVLSLFTTDGTA